MQRYNLLYLSIAYIKVAHNLRFLLIAENFSLEILAHSDHFQLLKKLKSLLGKSSPSQDCFLLCHQQFPWRWSWFFRPPTWHSWPWAQAYPIDAHCAILPLTGPTSASFTGWTKGGMYLISRCFLPRL